MKTIRNTSGFTIIEVAIVTAVIAILAMVTTLGYLGYQKQAASQKISATAARVMAGAEKYYAANNEYPGGGDLDVAGGFATPEKRSKALGIAADELEQDGAKFLFCANSGSRYTTGGNAPCNQPNTVYYVIDWWNNQDVTYASPLAGPCTLSFPAGDQYGGFSTFVVWYLNPQTNQWVYKRSTNGAVTISGPSCVFATS